MLAERIEGIGIEVKYIGCGPTTNSVRGLANPGFKLPVNVQVPAVHVL